MPRLAAGTRTSTSSRSRTQPFFLTLTNASSQHVKIARIAANDLSGLSAATLIAKLQIDSIQSAGNIFNAPTDGTQEVLGLKNRNTGVASLRFNARMGGSTSNTDVASPGGDYTTDTTITLGIRYDGANVTVWKNGYLVQTTAKTGAFGTLTGDWYINATGSGTTFHNISIAWFRAWNTALSNADMMSAMLSNYITSAIINVNFIEGTGTSTDLANGATVTFVNSPTWNTFEPRATP